MIKKGDVFKNMESGQMFTVKSIDPGIVIFGTKDGFHSKFVHPNQIESLFLPVVEEEVNKEVTE